MRKLATIQRVLNVRPIEGADKIEVVDVLGWSVVVSKGEFQPNDLCVYFEIDSWCDSSIPAFQSPVFEARYSNWGNKRGMRLKTIKLRGQISQGLVLPLHNFPEIQSPEEGQDVTDLLKIEKWEPLEEARSNNGGIQKQAGAGRFPSFLRKTDQERVQNYINELPKHADETFEVTIKLDGSSMTVYYVNQESEHYAHIIEDIEARLLRKKSFFGKLLYKAKKLFGQVNHPAYFTGVCSRNLEVDDNGNQFFEYAKEQQIREKLVNLGRNIAIQGELIAPSIQQNHEKVTKPEFYVFDVFDIDLQEYLLPQQARSTVELLGLNYVPVLETEKKLVDFEHEADNGSPEFNRYVVDQILAYAEGPGMNPGVKREGVVFKSNSSPFSFKAISNSYLLKKEKTNES
jgi:RNA ligase (TIGR02306 family)